MDAAMDTISRNRLRWKCRRGLLELDIVLARYLEKRPEDRMLPELLDLPDTELWDIICGRSDEYDPRFEETVARLRAV
jgi:succinate dehydrogenase flavin-adding protein (antitoxin of CptAB toxin-antitoxin module)